MNEEVFNGIFWISITANMIGLIIGLVKICSKSKCDQVEICCIKIHRNVQLEFEESKIEMERKPETKENV